MTERFHFHFSLSCIGGGNGNPLQCSCLENPRDGGAWWAAVSGVAQGQTWLNWLSSSSSTPICRYSLGFLAGLVSKEFACNVGDLGSIPGLGRSPGGGHDNPLQYFCLENPQGQRSLEGYSPWGHKELGTTEWLNTVYNKKCFKGEQRSLCNLEEMRVKWG